MHPLQQTAAVSHESKQHESVLMHPVPKYSMLPMLVSPPLNQGERLIAVQSAEDWCTRINNVINPRILVP
jgi:hypothetical protein